MAISFFYALRGVLHLAVIGSYTSPVPPRDLRAAFMLGIDTPKAYWHFLRDIHIAANSQDLFQRLFFYFLIGNNCIKNLLFLQQVYAAVVFGLIFSPIYNHNFHLILLLISKIILLVIAIQHPFSIVWAFSAVVIHQAQPSFWQFIDFSVLLKDNGQSFPLFIFLLLFTFPHSLCLLFFLLHNITNQLILINLFLI